MNSKAFKALTGAFALSFALSATAVAAPADKVRVFVGFKADQKAAVQRSLNAVGGKFHHSFDNLNAFAVSVPEQALNGLMNNPHVRYVEEDPKRFLMSQTQPQWHCHGAGRRSCAATFVCQSHCLHHRLGLRPGTRRPADQ